MEQVTNNVVLDRYANTRNPPNGAEMASTQILRVRIQSGSYKERKGEPHDDKCDLESEEVRSRVWTGVVPVWTKYGEPIQLGAGEVMDVPEHVSSYVKEQNEGNEAMALEAVKEPVKK